jgi:hypothetical protein
MTIQPDAQLADVAQVVLSVEGQTLTTVLRLIASLRAK